MNEACTIAGVLCVGLYYYGARYLDAKYSRWLSADPAVNDYGSGTSAGEGGIYNTVNFSLYHYAGNNPIRYTDPTGLFDDVSESCKDFIKDIEKFKPNIYDATDLNNKYEKGKSGDWTIGYGHKLTADELSSGIYDSGITQEEADKLFDQDLKKHIDGVNKNLSNSDKLTQNRFDALVDFSYTTGRKNFNNSQVKDTVEKYGDKVANSETTQTDTYKIDIADAFRYHVPTRNSPIHGGIKNRRYNEIQMFLYGDYKHDDTPSSISPSWKKGTKI
ncbi:glycoside hydrolase family protein [Treponema socranskii]|uniref:glycoside hydrolase family protein n=1 Tax=Treponema socranskii TaxID=53419 RepID=UPI003D8AA65E